MKNFLFALIAFFAITLFPSCNSYYQVLKTSSPDTKMNGDAYICENEDMVLTYNFWADGGSVSFVIENKRSQPLYIDWNKSHFIYNGISNEYWTEEESYTTTTAKPSSGLYSATRGLISNTSASNVSTFSARAKTKKILQIPPHASISVGKFDILKQPYYTCDFNFGDKKMNGKNVVAQQFVQNNTPFKFRNYITYAQSEQFDGSKVVDNLFYISEIINMTKKSFNGKEIKNTKCTNMGERYTVNESQYPYQTTNSFYIKVVPEIESKK